jgi:hypothetical protein
MSRARWQPNTGRVLANAKSRQPSSWRTPEFFGGTARIPQRTRIAKNINWGQIPIIKGNVG